MVGFERLFREIKLVTRDGKSLSLSEGLGDAQYVALYFSAHWCPPCVKFTPKLAKYYQGYAEKLKLKIIFVSHDQNIEEMEHYFSQMPWDLAVSDLKVAGKIAGRLGIKGIPCLKLFEIESGDIVCDNLVSEIYSDPEAKSFPYADKVEDKKGLPAPPVTVTGAGTTGAASSTAMPSSSTSSSTTTTTTTTATTSSATTAVTPSPSPSAADEKKLTWQQRRKANTSLLSVTNAIQALVAFAVAMLGSRYMDPQYRTAFTVVAAILAMYILRK